MLKISSTRKASRPDILVLGMTPRPDGEGVRLSDEAISRLSDAGIDPQVRLERLKASGKAGEIQRLQTDSPYPEAIVMVGLGDGSPIDARKAGAAVCRTIDSGKVASVEATAHLDPHSLRAFVEGLQLASFSFTLKSAKKKTTPPTYELAIGDGSAEGFEQALARAGATAAAVLLARELVNTPSLTKTPDWMASRAAKVASGQGLRIRVRREAELKAEGFGGILAVGKGSSRPPRLVELEYVPAGSKGSASKVPHIVLVGKGITFDSGGLSIKPADMMVPMKTDMTGAGVVLGVMSSLKELSVPVRVTGLLALAENLPGAAAMRPGDVVTHYGGRTSEVLNTDAEGRLVLGDGLAYAVKALDADVVIDIATLTGAATLGLGRGMGALYANRDGLAAGLRAAGDASGDKLWRMPLVPEYDEVLDGSIADARHVPVDKKVSGGSITAALYLQRFIDGRPWAHLDIAGPARSDAPRNEINKGGTAFGTRALLRWFEEGATGS